jgi:2-polyprenyl-3-methyl-5-hydroxy-6-metoxy-1,4-benzoquinol methylase
MSCLFCNADQLTDSFLPSTFFNGKRFDYKRCKKCELHFISPLPNEEDLTKMYPPSYQSGVDFKILKDPSKKLIGLRFSYTYQFDLLKSIQFQGRMLDFGCGTANFLINCNHHGFNCDGAEFNPQHVAILKEKIPSQHFYTVDELINSKEQYDLIRLSNVLEHFTQPREMMLALKKRLKPGGYFLLEGPIEHNFSWALQFRKLYFRLRKLLNKNYLVSHTPTHIIFTNLKNQRDFFDSLGLQEKHLKVSEAEWPFPPSFKKAQGVVSKLNVVIAKTSMLLQKLYPKWGNTFIYLGQKEL